MSKEADKFDSAKKRDATISVGLISSDEEVNVEEALANEFRGLYKSRLKEMQSVDEQREAAHRVSFITPLDFEMQRTRSLVILF